MTLLTFYPALSCDFVNYDDPDYVYENPQVLQGLTAQGFTWAWSSTHAANWHPLTWLSLMLDTTLYGGQPRGYHLTNLLLHLANVLLVYVLLRRLTAAVLRSFLVAALFAVHPLHVQSVVWVAERKDVLSTFFGLVALLAYDHYVRRPGLGRYGLIGLALVLTLLAKPMLVTLPFVLLLFDYWPLGRWQLGQPCPEETSAPGPLPVRTLLLEKAPLLVICAACSVVTVWAQSRGGAARSLEEYPFSWRAANAVMSYAQYLRQTFWPRDLAVFYPFPPGGPPAWQVVGAVLLIAGASAAAIRWGRHYPYLPVGWLFYLGTLVPVIGLVQVGQQARADRYTYVPLIGIFLLLSWSGGQLCSSAPWRRLARLVAGLVLVFLMLTSWTQAHFWHDNYTLWNRTVEVCESNVVHCYRGFALLRQGEVNAAEKDFVAALRLQPRDAQALVGLGIVFSMRGQMRQAELRFREAVAARPDFPEAHANLGGCLLDQGKAAEAARQLEEALRLRPSWPQARQALDRAREMTRGGRR
jgi:tetratricopeptide (TPR) repeat protein